MILILIDRTTRKDLYPSHAAGGLGSHGSCGALAAPDRRPQLMRDVGADTRAGKYGSEVE